MPITVELTANNTPYTWFWVDLRNGALVLELPPKVLGLADRWVGDVGITGPDKRKGGKYLQLPRGYKGDVPDGYYVLLPATFSVWFAWRSFLVDGDAKPRRLHGEEIQEDLPDHLRLLGEAREAFGGNPFALPALA